MWNLEDWGRDAELERVSKSAFDRGYEAGKLARATDEWQLERDRRLARDILAGFGPESFGGAGFRASLLDALRPGFGTMSEKTGIMGDARLDELLTRRLIYLLGGGGGTGLHDARAGGGDSDGGGDNEHQVVSGDDSSFASADETAPLMRNVLESERRESVRKLREIEISSGGFVKALAGAIGVEWRAPRVAQTIATIRDRLIHLLGGDEPDLQKSPIFEDSDTNDAGEITITDELRKFKGHINAELTPEMVLALRAEVNCIADRIDAQFDRICEQQETVLQATIDSMCEEQDRLQERLRTAELGCNANHRLAKANARWCDELVDLLRDAAREYEDKHHWAQVWHDRAEDMRMERDELQQAIDKMTVELDSARAKNRRLVIHIGQMQGGSRKWREQCEQLKAERDELQSKLDDYDKTHVALPKDADGEYIHIGDVMDCGEHFGIQEVEGFIHGAVAFTVCDPQPARICTCPAHMTRHYHEPTVEQVIRDLTLGKITESQAVERIEGMHDKG